ANLARHRQQVQELARELQPLVREFHGMPVICSVMSADLAGWLGLNVAGEFRRDEDLSLRNMQDVISKARHAEAKVVIDNYQSSGKVGRTLARQLDLPLVVFSNFPAPPPEGGSGYAATLRGNLQALADAL
ncbi:MAG: hypothetical protein LC725_05330, partial [Lentisphaerae bacterium]|nr:hypothetical protein [Lentisphaerota bacterium]